VFCRGRAQRVKMAASEMPDLILMDVALGDMDGWEATRLIKANPQTVSIPIIALTAHALASDRETSVKVGCSEFDTKPVDYPVCWGRLVIASPTRRRSRAPPNSLVW